jgi:hypothetical protein
MAPKFELMQARMRLLAERFDRGQIADAELKEYARLSCRSLKDLRDDLAKRGTAAQTPKEQRS